MFNWALLGTLSVQAYIYYLAFPNDRKYIKALAVFILCIEFVQTVLATIDAFRNFGYGWGNMISLNEVGILWLSVPAMTGIISCLAQLFYAWRIWILSQSYYIPVFVTLLALIQGASGIWTGVNAFHIGLFSEVLLENGTSTIVWLGGTALCDIIIAASMIYYLSRSRSGFRATNAILSKLIRITVETGFITAALAVVDLSMFLAFEQANYHLTPSITLSKLYSNSLMTLLNSRVRIVGGRNNGTSITDVTLSQLGGANNGSSFEMSKTSTIRFHEPDSTRPGDSHDGINQEHRFGSVYHDGLQESQKNSAIV
ncbi:hypothetical protein K435DRAFT_762603 [Dendrothele bispora CBS 962.96]|uniref:DUF6534 domain-containing protein n=1 Tax=Dendrothele bispora (strain CBS 962.96) TaxID=1314807 RepID=A0A4S8LF92_DENBC|nr:hypothetical protein K435DRAFT_762603 [Dendrothele bispora CBS 962.96]